MKKLFAVAAMLAVFAGVSWGQKISVQSFPSGGEAFIDGVDTGQTTPTGNIHITDGTHTILVQSPIGNSGWNSNSVQTTITGSGNSTVNMVLLPVLTTGPAGPAGPQGTAGFNGSQGAQGSTGAMGPAGQNMFAGFWVSGTNYQVGQTVLYVANNVLGVYLNVSGISSASPNTDSVNWATLISSGGTALTPPPPCATSGFIPTLQVPDSNNENAQIGSVVIPFPSLPAGGICPGTYSHTMFTADIGVPGNAPSDLTLIVFDATNNTVSDCALGPNAPSLTTCTSVNQTLTIGAGDTLLLGTEGVSNAFTYTMTGVSWSLTP
jgi:hypothetical protein